MIKRKFIGPRMNAASLITISFLEPFDIKYNVFFIDFSRIAPQTGSQIIRINWDKIAKEVELSFNELFQVADTNWNKIVTCSQYVKMVRKKTHFAAITPHLITCSHIASKIQVPLLALSDSIVSFVACLKNLLLRATRIGLRINSYMRQALLRNLHTTWYNSLIHHI